MKAKILNELHPLMIATMPHALKTLSMDSAAQVGSVALLAGPRLLAQDHFQGAVGHAVLLPEKLACLLAQEGCSCADLDLIVVTIGPGAFAGLRIALGCAKGIALVNGTPMVGVSNLDVLAAGTGRREGWVSVVVDARRGEIFAALYRLENGIPCKHHAPDRAQSPAAWAATLAAMPELQQKPICLTGTGLGAYADVFREVLAVPFDITPESAWITDPFLLGLLGQQLFLKTPSLYQNTQHTFPSDFTMLLDYQRRPDAEEKKYGNLCVSGP